MLQYHADDSRLKVITYPEIALIFVIFIYILYILYPGKLQYKKILAEKSNYALSIVYLENILRLEPENIDLMLAVTQVSLENGNIELSEKLIEFLNKSENSTIQKELNLLNYKLLKEKNQRTTKDEEIEKNKIQMQNILKKVAKEGVFRKEDALIWYSKALSLKQKEEAILFLKPLYEKNNIYALEQCVYLATILQYVKERVYCIEKLTQIDAKASKKWLVAAYIMYISNNENEKALKILKKLVEIDFSYRNELARVQQLIGNFKESSQLYIFLYDHSDNLEEKKYYLEKAIEVLMAGKLSHEATALIKKYEESYLDDDEIMKKFLKLYLGMSELESARKLSVKLFNKDNQE